MTRRHTSRSRRWSTALLAGATASALVLTGCGSDDEHAGHEHTGSDAHEHIDPIAADPAVTAQAVASTVLTWNPAQQDSPWELATNFIEDTLTGDLADKAGEPSSSAAMADRPKQWDGWAAGGATMKAVVLDVELADEDDDEVTAVVEVQQTLNYPDGSSSRWKKSTQEVHLVAENGRWKANSLKETAA